MAGGMAEGLAGGMAAGLVRSGGGSGLDGAMVTLGKGRTRERPGLKAPAFGRWAAGLGL